MAEPGDEHGAEQRRAEGAPERPEEGDRAVPVPIESVGTAFWVARTMICMVMPMPAPSTMRTGPWSGATCAGPGGRAATCR